jgi:recombination protein RecA
MMEISDKVLIASGLKEDPNAPVVEDIAEDEASAFTEADDAPISLD